MRVTAGRLSGIMLLFVLSTTSAAGGSVAVAKADGSQAAIANVMVNGVMPAWSCNVKGGQQPQPVRKRSARMFGWLWRSTRNVDIERNGTPLLFYLRSPLLAAQERVDCQSAAMIVGPALPTCALLAVNTSDEDAWSVTVALPQLDAASPGRLAARLRARLARGETVALRSASGGEIRLDPDAVRHLKASSCVVDA